MCQYQKPTPSDPFTTPSRANGPLPLRDSLIAAIVRARGCRIVTRDTAPFERMGCKVVDPWK
jgi:predicted nucleic acid-binding protein